MTIAPNGSPQERIGQFLDFLWADVDGVVYIPTKDPSKTAPHDWERKYFSWPKSRDKAIGYIIANNAAGKDVFMAPAIFNKEVVKKLSDPDPKKRQTDKGDILGTNVIWAEFDGNAPDSWTPSAVEAASDQPGGSGAASLGPPSLRVQSSTASKQHCYWRLKEFSTDTSFVENVNRAIAYAQKADLSGWDINQVLRPVETNNHKYPDAPLVIVYEQTEVEYSLQEFSSLNRKPKEYVTEAIDFSNLPPVAEVLGKYQWDEDDLDLINKEKDDFAGDRSGGLMRIGYSGAELGCTDEEILSLLLSLDDRWGKFKGRNDRSKQLITIVNRARQKYPHAVESVTFAGLLKPPAEAKESVDQKLVYGWGDIVNADIQIEWMIEGFMPKGGLGLLASAPGVGKTQFFMQLGAACCLGKPFLDYVPIRPHKIMFFSLEMGLATIKYFTETMDGIYSGEEKEVLQRNFMILPHGQAIDLMKAEGRKGFEYVLDTYQPEGVYIDSLQKIYLQDLSKDEIRGLFVYLQRIRANYGVYINLVHHDRKATEGNKRPRDQSDIFGSTYITAEPDSILHLWRPSPESKHIELRALKLRLSPPQEKRIITRGEHLQFVEDNSKEAEEITYGGLRGSTKQQSDLNDGRFG
jgi:hypothetical protein